MIPNPESATRRKSHTRSDWTDGYGRRDSTKPAHRLKRQSTAVEYSSMVFVLNQPRKSGVALCSVSEKICRPGTEQWWICPKNEVQPPKRVYFTRKHRRVLIDGKSTAYSKKVGANQRQNDQPRGNAAKSSNSTSRPLTGWICPTIEAIIGAPPPICLHKPASLRCVA